MSHQDHRLLNTRALSLSLLVGALATLFMSWVLPTVLIHFQVVKHRVELTDRAFLGPDGREHDVWFSRLWIGDWYQLYPRAGGGPSDNKATLPSWVAVPNGQDGAIRVDTAATGWPIRAFASEAWIYPGPRPTDFRWNIVLKSNSNGRTILPLRPLWFGLLSDTILLGAAWFGLCAAVGALIRRRRLARGQCSGCGYDARGSASRERCPECGTPYKSETFDPRNGSTPIG